LKIEYIYSRLFSLRSLTGGISPFANARKYLLLEMEVNQKMFSFYLNEEHDYVHIVDVSHRQPDSLVVKGFLFE